MSFPVSLTAELVIRLSQLEQALETAQNIQQRHKDHGVKPGLIAEAIRHDMYLVLQRLEQIQGSGI